MVVSQRERTHVFVRHFVIAEQVEQLRGDVGELEVPSHVERLGAEQGSNVVDATTFVCQEFERHRSVSGVHGLALKVFDQ